MKSDTTVVMADSALPKTPGELAQALSGLNRRIEPVPDIQAAYRAEVQAQQDMPLFAGTLRTSVGLQLGGLQLVLLKLAATEIKDCRVLKFFENGPRRRFLASAGAHLPGSLQQENDWVMSILPFFAENNHSIGVEICFADNSVLEGQVRIEKTASPVLVALGESLMYAPSIWQKATQGAGAYASALDELKAQVTDFTKAVEKPYVGRVDGIVADRLEGWVWCPFKPEARYEIQAWLENRLVGYCMANLWREDLEQAGKGDGRVKFELSLSKSLFDGAEHLIQLRIVGQGYPDVSADFGNPVAFKSSSTTILNSLAGSLMGYDLDQKLASSFAERQPDSEAGKLLADLMPKISLHLGNLNGMAARELIDLALQKEPTNGLALIKAAESWLVEGNFEKAQALFSDVARRSPKLLWAHTGMSEALKLAGKKQEAIASLEKAQLISSEYPGLKLKLATLKSELLFEQEDHKLDPDRFNEALQQMKQALLQSPADLELVKTIARLEYKGDSTRTRVLDFRFTPDEVLTAQQNRFLLEACLSRVK